ncbi:hypothetical protein EYF80_001877 [Liparis tanakae]|uniref:Uncharacterized protein n=1 Tax=Liparis tanakae TaxID=230148 RepID=A0A4Z2JDT0_9TELE|nr:hypothetical protein EYF80_001877 [Liparis tanakae]
MEGTVARAGAVTLLIQDSSRLAVVEAAYIYMMIRAQQRFDRRSGVDPRTLLVPLKYHDSKVEMESQRSLSNEGKMEANMLGRMRDCKHSRLQMKLEGASGTQRRDVGGGKIGEDGDWNDGITDEGGKMRER